MRYIYIIILMIILFGMFIFGNNIPSSQVLTYSDSTNVSIDDSFCSDEVKKYKEQLIEAEQKLSTLNALLQQTEKDKSLTTYSSN